MKKLITEGINITQFLRISYAGSRHPNNTSVEDFLFNKKLGANCELFGLAVWHEAGFYTEQKRSIELWHDTDFTSEVCGPPYKPFDNFLFLPKGIDPHKLTEEIEILANFSGGDKDISEFKKFHQAIYTPSDDNPTIPLFLHLAKPGPSDVWRFEDFEKCDKEYWLFKVKRPTRRAI